MEEATVVDNPHTRNSFNGSQYSTNGQAILVFIDRAKQYFIAYAMDKGGRNQLLLYQFKFEDKTKDPFSLPRPLITDGKHSGEKSIVAILTENFNSEQVGIHLIYPEKGISENKTVLTGYFAQLLKNSSVIKAGFSFLGEEKCRNGDAFSLGFTANGVVLRGGESGYEYPLSDAVQRVRMKTQ